MSNQAIFLDRDGTIIHDQGYPRDADAVRLISGAGTALASLKGMDFLLVIVSTQSGVGRGLLTADDVMRVHDRMSELLIPYGVTFDDYRYCLHAPWEACECRKPSPLMLQEAARALDVHLQNSFMIGDKWEDVEAGRRAGSRTILLKTNRAPRGVDVPPDLVASSWVDALHFIQARIVANE